MIDFRIAKLPNRQTKWLPKFPGIQFGLDVLTMPTGSGKQLSRVGLAMHYICPKMILERDGVLNFKV